MSYCQTPGTISHDIFRLHKKLYWLLLTYPIRKLVFTMIDKTITKREKGIIENVIKILKEEVNPERIILFGSRAKERNDETSDFDFAIDSASVNIRCIRRIRERIEPISGLYSVDIIFLDEVDKDFRKIIISTGRVIYEKGT